MINNFELTQSSLKDWVKSENKEQWVDHWVNKNRKFERSESFVYGSLLDCFLFEPEKLTKRFSAYKGKCRPSDKQQAVIGSSVLKLKEMTLEEALLESSKELSYGGRWKNQTLLAKFSDLTDYIEFCKENKYKTVVMYDFAKDIQNLAKYLVEHEPNFLRQYIVKDPSEDYRNEFQLTLRAELYGVPCKIILDILHFDEINSTVRVIDFKTTYDALGFSDSIKKYGYDWQVSFYDKIVELNSEIFEGYTLIEPLNIVISKRDLGDTYVHHYNYNDLKNCEREWIPIVKEIGEYLKNIK